MEARLVREELQKCWKGEGTNHLSNCKELAERYAQMIRDNKVGYSCCEGVLELKCARSRGTRSSTRNRAIGTD